MSRAVYRHSKQVNSNLHSRSSEERKKGAKMLRVGLWETHHEKKKPRKINQAKTSRNKLRNMKDENNENDGNSAKSRKCEKCEKYEECEEYEKYEKCEKYEKNRCTI